MPCGPKNVGDGSLTFQSNVAVQRQGRDSEVEWAFARAINEDRIVLQTKARGELAGTGVLRRAFLVRQGDRLRQVWMSRPALVRHDGGH